MIRISAVSRPYLRGISAVISQVRGSTAVSVNSDGLVSTWSLGALHAPVGTWRVKPFEAAADEVERRPT